MEEVDPPVVREAALDRQHVIGACDAPVTSGPFHPRTDNLPPGTLDDTGSDLHALLAIFVEFHLRLVGGEIVDALRHGFIPVTMWRERGDDPTPAATSPNGMHARRCFEPRDINQHHLAGCGRQGSKFILRIRQVDAIQGRVFKSRLDRRPPFPGSFGTIVNLRAWQPLLVAKSAPVSCLLTSRPSGRTSRSRVHEGECSTCAWIGPDVAQPCETAGGIEESTRNADRNLPRDQDV